MSKTVSALIFAALLIAATLAIYLPGIGNSLVFDDARLTDGTIFDSYGSLLVLRPRTLSYGSFVWVKALFGEAWWVQRVVNLLLHLGVAAGLYVLFRDLLRSTQFSEATKADPHFEASCRAALRIGVALFALNPVAVYAVAYLIQRSTVMAALFVVLACAAWVRGLRTRRAAWFAAALVAYVLAVMSKESAFMAATLAVPLYVFVARPGWKRIAGVVGIALVATIAIAAVLYSVYGSIVGVAFDTSSRLYALQLEAQSPGISARLFPLSVLNQAAQFFHYGVLWLIPNIQWMAIDLRPAFPLSYFAFPQVLGALAFVALLAGSAWLLLRRSDALGLLGLCLLCPALLFFSEFVTVWVQDPFVLYRSYLWALVVPGLVALLLIGWKPKTLYPVGVVLAALFGALALERVLSFNDELSVWNDAVDKIDLRADANAVGRWRPYLNRGTYYLERDRAEEALEDFTRADQLGEVQGSARFSMGVALQMMKKHDEALAAFAKAESMGFNEAGLYYQRGESQMALRRFGDAADSYTASLAKPQAEKAADVTRMRRVEAALQAQRYDVAIAALTEMLKKKPDDYGLQARLATAYVGKREPATAMPIFDKLLAARPTASAFYGRAMAHLVAGDKQAGLGDLDRAIALEPGNLAFQSVRAQIAGPKK